MVFQLGRLPTKHSTRRTRRALDSPEVRCQRSHQGFRIHLGSESRPSSAHQHRQPSLEARPATKRMIYSEITKIFDPLRLIAPVIVLAKLLMQQLWKTKTGWDDVSEEIQQQWLSLQKALPQLNFI